MINVFYNLKLVHRTSKSYRKSSDVTGYLNIIFFSWNTNYYSIKLVKYTFTIFELLFIRI